MKFKNANSLSKGSFSGHNEIAPPTGIYTLLGQTEEVDNKNGSLADGSNVDQRNEWANLLTKHVAAFSEKSTTAAYASKIGPSLKYWKRRARKPIWNQKAVGSMTIRGSVQEMVRQ